MACIESSRIVPLPSQAYPCTSKCTNAMVFSKPTCCSCCCTPAVLSILYTCCTALAHGALVMLTNCLTHCYNSIAAPVIVNDLTSWPWPLVHVKRWCTLRAVHVKRWWRCCFKLSYTAATRAMCDSRRSTATPVAPPGSGAVPAVKPPTRQNK